jgi:hypothetical protein
MFFAASQMADSAFFSTIERSRKLTLNAGGADVTPLH